MFHWRLHPPRKANFKVYRLRYAGVKYEQYQVVVKLPGSFRLTAGNRHLHRYCIFTERVSETVAQSLHYSTRGNLPRKELRSSIPLTEGLYLHPALAGVWRLVSEDSTISEGGGDRSHPCSLGIIPTRYFHWYSKRSLCLLADRSSNTNVLFSKRARINALRNCLTLSLRTLFFYTVFNVHHYLLQIL